MIRVLVVDDHELVRTTVVAALRGAAGIEVVGSCTDGQEAVDAAERTRPDVVLMDLSMPRLGGVEATRRLLATRPGLRIVVLTSMVSGRRVQAALAAGAVACVVKDADTAHVIDAVRAAVSSTQGSP